MSISNSYTIRIHLPQQGDVFSEVLATIHQLNGHVGAIDIVKTDNNTITRDITIETQNDAHAQKIYDALSHIKDVTVGYMSDRTFMLHLGGKIEIKNKIAINHRDELSMVYTPGVARVCMAIYAAPEKALNLTIKKNMVAVVTDGTAVLGLGDIGPLAAMPVMEGKAMLFKKFGDVNAFPICLATKDVEEIISTVKNIAPVFGGINLEDIASPRCFEIEKRLKAELDIPVFHDDQHGTAIVMTAALINALKIVKKKMSDIKVVFSGVGAAGTACANMLLDLGVNNIIGCDRLGALHMGRENMDAAKKIYAEKTNPNQEKGSLHQIIQNADVFVGLSAPNTLTVDDLKIMSKDPIVFAMANPDPEIAPELAAPHVAIFATGRSDYPNQINNVLAFPGIFRGALDCQASDINGEMNLAAAYAIANIVDAHALSPDYIIPSVFNADVAPAVAKAVMEAARKSGVARK
ncbi:MAG: malate dehydrogenase [Gammaproteobacteria bacterium RIFCSPLOWO2_02_FULL_42_14]|nr:MAG: malate dehydrogenase [Gammaproteobacteria bacterium RIFCSPHIGHO2_02_FULL_42_43]OGT51549.1 MAG: malate dehydrogenase [Gammaproteobacteria bacterium RIFCSPHIGHO2_12_FULL_41_25]OGT62248.1 MAG: malate dehydrogenase [Gammaproteobacteria bacterium RIFCSPLOWO2_02_FULL_42_14]OGT85923.1 MAG: malate dehydrogenase [Gammaproteobacteria bacterium RIFCSPLOWO2_12_FULL_42_18]